MCILCVVQKWSRRVATMLPWLVIPLIMLWALSQLFPPSLRFEITSPRLACVLVLLLTLFWYEILMPQLSAWRAGRSARLRERRRIEAIELQKLRKTATRRCRNCHTPYRDQNPGGGGRFMCSYCGHVSKRPVLEIPGMARGSGIIGEKYNQDWSLESAGDWVHAAPRYLLGGDEDERCSTVRSYSGMFVLARRLLSWFFLRTRWLWRKVFRSGSLGEDSYSDAENRGLLSGKGDNEGGFQESRGEKARRKAEEKRQARLDKEMLEEEERKQREEVARLVEERRRLRDEKLEAEKKHSKSLSFGGERGGRKEAERRRQERRKEKDKGSNKSNSDGEELEKSVSRDSERKREFDKKAEHASESVVHGSKMVANKTRYFDQMKGTFLSSSRGFNNASLFGRNDRSREASATKANKPAVVFVDSRLGHGNARDSHYTGHVNGKLLQSGDNRPMGSDAQPRTTVLKKSWHQLFTRASAVSSYPDTDTRTFATQNNLLEDQSVQSARKEVLNLSTDNQINSQGTLPSTINPSTSDSFNTKSGHDSMPEDTELFEDPCYVPDPISLLGSASESIDDLPLDLGAGFDTNGKIEGPHLLKNVSASVGMNKPSPIESPMSRLRGSKGRYTASGQAICTPKSQKVQASNLDDPSRAREQGGWQLWDTPLAQDALGLIGGPSGWLFPIGPKKSIQEDVLPLPDNSMVSQLAKENHAVPATHSAERIHIINPPNGGVVSPLGHGLNGSHPCIQNSAFQPVPVDGESHFLPHGLIDNTARNEVIFGIPDSSAAGHPFERPPANCWSMGDWRMHGPKDVGAQFPTTTNPNTHSLWSFN